MNPLSCPLTVCRRLRLFLRIKRRPVSLQGQGSNVRYLVTSVLSSVPYLLSICQHFSKLVKDESDFWHDYFSASRISLKPRRFHNIFRVQKPIFRIIKSVQWIHLKNCRVSSVLSKLISPELAKQIARQEYSRFSSLFGCFCRISGRLFVERLQSRRVSFWRCYDRDGVIDEDLRKTNVCNYKLAVDREIK